MPAERSVGCFVVLALTLAPSSCVVLKMPRHLHRNLLQMRNCTTTKIRLARLEFDANNLRNSKRILESLTPTHNDHGGPPWEWKYLDGLLNASEHRWDMVIDGVEWIGALAYSPDGCLIAISNRVPKFDSTRFGTKGRITIRD